jgi:hypothetical protein
MSEGTDFFREWRLADRVAHELEKLITQQSLAALQGASGPSDADKNRARRLREAANDLFHLAMEEMRAAAERNRHA